MYPCGLIGLASQWGIKRGYLLSEHRTQSWEKGVLSISHHKQVSQRTLSTALTKERQNCSCCLPTLPLVTSHGSKVRRLIKHSCEAELFEL